MKIATLGSCQANIINWYMRQLFPQDTIKWVFPEIFKQWELTKDCIDENRIFKDQIHHNIWNHDEGIDYLKSADYIIYQKIEPKTSDLFNFNKIESYKKKDAKTVSLTYILYSPSDLSLLEGMIKRESALLPDIKVSDIIVNNPKKNEFKFNKDGTPPGAHCNSTLFLEIVREICKILNFKFFNDDQYKHIESLKYPFGDL